MMSSIYEICVDGHIDPGWSDWLDGVAVICMETGRTILRGEVADQAALHGLIARIRDLNLKLVYVKRLDEQSEVRAEPDYGV